MKFRKHLNHIQMIMTYRFFWKRCVIQAEISVYCFLNIAMIYLPVFSQFKYHLLNWENQVLVPIRFFYNRKSRQPLFDIMELYEQSNQTENIEYQQAKKKIYQLSQFQQSLQFSILDEYLHSHPAKKTKATSYTKRVYIEYKIQKTQHLQKYYQSLESKVHDMQEIQSTKLLKNLIIHLSQYLLPTARWKQRRFIETSMILNNLLVLNKKRIQQVLQEQFKNNYLFENVFFDNLWTQYEKSFESILILIPSYVSWQCAVYKFVLINDLLRNYISNHQLGKQWFTQVEECSNQSQKYATLQKMIINILKTAKWYENQNLEKVHEDEGQDLFIICSEILTLLTELVMGYQKENTFLQLPKESIDTYNSVYKRRITDFSIEERQRSSYSDFLYYSFQKEVIEYLYQVVLSSKESKECIGKITQNLDPDQMGEAFFIRMYDLCVEFKILGLKKLKRQKYHHGLRLLEHGDKLHQYYLNKPEFQHHNLFQISYQLYRLIQMLSQCSKKFQFYFDKRIKIIKNWLGNQSESEEFKANDITEDELVFYSLFFKIQKSIEIVTSQNKIIRIYFLQPQLCYKLSRRTKNNFILSCPVEDSKKKVKYLLDNLDVFQMDMKYHSDVGQFWQSSIYSKQNYFEKNGWRVYYLIILINILCYYNDLNKHSGEHFYEGSLPERISGTILFVCCLYFTLAWYYLVFPLARDQLIEKYIKENLDIKSKSDFFKKRKYKYLRIIFNDIYWIDYLIDFFGVNLILVSLALYHTSDIYYSWMLLSIIKLNPRLHYILEALTSKTKQFGSIALFVLIIMFIYAKIGFEYYAPEYFSNYMMSTFHQDDPSGKGGYEPICQEITECILNYIYYGLRWPTGISDVMLIKSYQTDPWGYIFKWVHDLSFFILLKIICMSIIFGIIHDTYAEKRVKGTIKDNDRQNVCFICQKNKIDFEKQGSSWSSHCQYEHHLFNYVYYIIRLSQMENIDFNAIEVEIQEKINAKDSSWFPINRSYEIEKNKKQKEEETGSKEMNIDTLNQKFDDLEEDFNAQIEILMDSQEEKLTCIKSNYEQQLSILRQEQEEQLQVMKQVAQQLPKQKNARF